MINQLHLAANHGATISEKANVACQIAETHEMSVLLLHKGLRINVTPLCSVSDVREAYAEAERERGNDVRAALAGLAVVPAQLLAPPGGTTAADWIIMVVIALVCGLLGWAFQRYVNNSDQRMDKVEETLTNKVEQAKKDLSEGISENRQDVKDLRETVHEQYARSEEVGDLRQDIRGLRTQVSQLPEQIANIVTSS